MTYLSEMIERRDDAQSQLDALCGECPEVCERLIREIASLDRRIAEAIADGHE